MNEYTLKDWLSGEIKAVSSNFPDKEWDKVKKKQKEIYDQKVERYYNACIEEFDKAVKDSCNKEAFIKSGFESLDRLIDTEYKYPIKEIRKDKYHFVRNIQLIPFIEEYKFDELRNAILSVLEGRHFYHLIYYHTTKSRTEFDNTVSIKIFASALIKFHKFIRDNYLKEISDNDTINEKIKWLGSPSQFGYLILELIKNGFIEPPKTRGVYSYAKLAEQCFNAFQMDTTVGTLKKEISKSNSLTEANSSAFKIPNINDLS